MNLVADESVDGQVVAALRAAGHDVAYVAELTPGLADHDVLRQSETRNALLVTADKDFGELVFRQKLVHYGVLLLRLAGLPPPRKAQLVQRFIESHGNQIGKGFSVITPDTIRIRRAQR